MPRRCFSPARRLLLAAWASATASFAGVVPARALQPFAADYEATYMGFSAQGSLSLEHLGGERWKCTLKVTHPIAQLTQVTEFENRAGQWRPLSGTDVSVLLVKQIRRHAVYDWDRAEARWSGDVKPDRAGPVALQAGDLDGLLMNLAVTRDVIAGKPLQYRMVDEGRAKAMAFRVADIETITVDGQTRRATKVVSGDDSRQMLVWVVEGLPLPARILQRKNGKDEIDLRLVSVR